MLSRALATVSFLSLLAVPCLAGGDTPKAGGKPGATNPSKPAEKPVMWAVVEVGKDHKVMKVDEIADLKKKEEAAYKEALAKYEEAKKAATAAKKPFKEEAPKQTMVKVLKEDFKTEAEAKAYATKAEKPEKKPDSPAPKKNGG